MSKEQFDFSRPEDQEQFNALPEEVKETLVEKAQEEAKEENRVMDEKIEHQTQRVLSDADLVHGGAEYVMDEDADKLRLKITDAQLGDKKMDMWTKIRPKEYSRDQELYVENLIKRENVEKGDLIEVTRKDGTKGVGLFKSSQAGDIWYGSINSDRTTATLDSNAFRDVTEYQEIDNVRNVAKGFVKFDKKTQKWKVDEKVRKEAARAHVNF